MTLTFSMALTLGLVLSNADWKNENFAGPVPEEIVRSRNGQIELVNILGSRQWRHSTEVVCVAFSPDGKRAVSGGSDETKLWEVESGREIATWRHDDRVLCIAFSPDGKRVLWGGWKYLVLWNAESGEMIARWKGEEWRGYLSGDHLSVAFSSDGKRAAFTGGPGRSGGLMVRLWDLEKGGLIGPRNGHIVAISADVKQAVIVTNEGSAVKLWDVERGTEIATIAEGQKGITCGAFSSNGKQLLLLQRGFGNKGVDVTTCQCRLWDVERGKEIKTWKVPSRMRKPGDPEGREVNCMPEGVVLSPDGKYALIIMSYQVRYDPVERFGIRGDIVTLWDVESGTYIATLYADTRRPLVFTPDSKYVLNGARTFDVKSGKEVELWKGTIDGEVKFIAVSPDGKRALIASGNRLSLWDIDTGKEVGVRKEPEINTSWGNGVLFSPDDRYILSGRTLWEVKSGKRIAGWKINVRSSGDPIFSPDGKHLLVGSISSSIDGRNELASLTLLDAASGKEIATWTAKEGKGHNVGVHVAYSPDGKRVLSWSDWDGTVKLWDVKSGKEIAAWKATIGGQSLLYAAFTPDGGRVRAVTETSCKVWDPERGEEIAAPSESNISKILALSPDGNYALATRADHELRLVDFGSGKRIVEYEGYQGTIYCAAFTSDGKYVLSGGSDKTIRLWDVSTGKEVDSIVVDGLPLRIAVSRSDLIAVWNRNGTITVYRLKERKSGTR
jgi:WD40 repeat protein